MIVQLFKFAQGDRTFYLTSGAMDVSYDSHTWESTPIGLEESVVQKTDPEKATLGVGLSAQHDLALLMLQEGGDLETKFTLYRQVDGVTTIWWVGRVASAKLDSQSNKVVLTCENVFTGLRIPGLRARYQRRCRWAIYGVGCTVDKASYGVPATLLSTSGKVVEITEAAAQADGYYRGGMVVSSAGAGRWILLHKGTALTLDRPFNHTAGHTFTIYPGCDKDLDTCHTKFNNVPNFGGCPFIPTSNPYLVYSN